MIGTIVNALAIVAGSLLGLVLKKGMPERMERAVMQMLGLAVIIIGANGIITNMLTVNPSTGALSSSGELLLLGSLAVGIALGELCRIDDSINRLGKYIESKVHTAGFAQGFINASIIYCVGAMAIMGALSDGLRGDSSVLFIKSALDFICSIILASTLGVGVLFSAITVLVYQGSISLLASTLGSALQPEMLGGLFMVGYAIVCCIGINLIGFAKIKTANLLPALVIPLVVQMVLSWL